ncbi:putative histidine kinase-group xi protein [Phaeomoniella chlamydospora]|uniref:Putative histidine kinase-group xi protein n=1 Tax=Phaeomoniella chlamydospora TaxID=158046 RepID=A0A0G2EQS8_PHACM|nr:putative histidine kinase-group xi protein [Phaeomoniella chlamydospora]
MKFTRFADRAPIGFGLVDTEGTIIYSNDRWHQITGIRKGDTSPDAWINCVIEDDKEMLAANWTKLMVHKETIRFFAHFKHPWKSDNHERSSDCTTGLCTGLPEFDELGNVKAIMSIIMDVSELRWAFKELQLKTKELEQSEASYRKFADMAPIGVARAQPTGKLIYANETWLDLMNLTLDAPPMAWVSSIHLEDKNTALAAWYDVIEGKSRTLEVRLAAMKSYPPVDASCLVSLYPEYDVEGGMQIICWMTDISAQKEAELTLHKKMDEALEMKRQQENFIDMTSHEIRNPLSAILHCADEINVASTDYQDKLATCEAASSIDNLGDMQDLLLNIIEAAQTISYCVQHQKRIVDDVLTLSKLDSDLLLITPTPSMPATIVREALRMFDAEVRDADISINFVEDPSLNILNVQWVLLDPSRVLQVLINLTTNAIKFTRKSNKRSITVTMAASKTKPSEIPGDTVYFPRPDRAREASSEKQWPLDEVVYLSLSVKDTGCGLSPSEKKNLFNRFTQGSPKTHIKYGGSGLGLFISRELVERQGGEIGLSSIEKEGSTFVFFIKAKRTTPPKRPSVDLDKPTKVHLENIVGHKDVSVAEQHDGQLLATLPRRPNVKQSDLKILVVEDNLVNQKVLSKQLRRHGHTVEVANHGLEALNTLRYGVSLEKGEHVERKFDVILMDIEMPVMDGLTCIKNVRQLEEMGVMAGRVPAIAVTANVRSEHVQVAMAAGFDDVTTKPYRISDILSQIHRTYLQNY